MSSAQSPLPASAAIPAIDGLTVRDDAEKHLAQMAGKYRGLLEAAPDAMVVVNQGGEIVLLNLQAEKQFGYRRDELVGQPVKNIIPEGFAEQQIGTGLELTGRRKDGSEFPIEQKMQELNRSRGDGPMQMSREPAQPAIGERA